MGSTAKLRLPGGGVAEAGGDDLIGRSQLATVRIDDPRVSTIHAEVSRRAGGLLLIARGGRLLVEGRAVPQVLLEPGLKVALAPGVFLEVIEVDLSAEPVVPSTVGRERLRIRGGSEVTVHLLSAPEPLIRIGGVRGALMRRLMQQPGEALSWEAVAEAVWPDDAEIRGPWREAGRPRRGAWTPIDEKRFRNRWDQQLAALRRQLETVRDGGLLRVGGGTVALVLGPADVVEPAAEG